LIGVEEILLVVMVGRVREPVCRLHPGRQALRVPVFHFSEKIVWGVVPIGVYEMFSSFSEIFWETNG
jgi:hypothetical protein